MITRHFACLGALVTGALVSAMGCSNQGDGGENTGVAQIAISQVPFDGSVGCIAVTATGAHTVTQSMDVAPGQSTVFNMTGLPMGTVSFLGDAYQGPCAAVTPASAATWVSDAVLASVNNVQPVMVHLMMHRSGKAGVDVDFQEEPACRADGAPCFVGAECCSQSCVAGACSSAPPACPPWLTSCNNACVDLASDPSNCGTCGSMCPPNMACQNGACTDSCMDGNKNGAESDIDCGGWCAPCPQGKACLGAFDCQSGYCANGICAQAGCQTPFECPGTDTECQTRTCIAGTCGFSFNPAGTWLNTQTAGDCTRAVCDGNGSAAFWPDDADAPFDGNDCTIDVCSGGIPIHMPAPTGMFCNQNGGAVCDGTGSCVECLTAADCPGAPNECQMPACFAGTCGFSFTAAGTTVSMQTAGDCKRAVCNGAGTAILMEDDTDIPSDDGNQCTFGACVNGTPAHPPVPAGTACSQNGGTTCDGSGNCI